MGAGGRRWGARPAAAPASAEFSTAEARTMGPPMLMQTGAGAVLVVGATARCCGRRCGVVEGRRKALAPAAATASSRSRRCMLAGLCARACLLGLCVCVGGG